MSNEKLFRNRKEFFTNEDIDKNVDDYEGKLCVLAITSLHQDYQKPQFQLFKATGGFGCKVENIGTKVFGVFVADEENAQMRRGQFLGVLKDEVIKELGICPSCLINTLHEDEVMNSLSRRDNETYICNDCSVKESMEDFGL